MRWPVSGKPTRPATTPGLKTAVFETEVYAEFGQPDTCWADDRIIGDPTTDGRAITLAAAKTSEGPGTLGLITQGADI